VHRVLRFADLNLQGFKKILKKYVFRAIIQCSLMFKYFLNPYFFIFTLQCFWRL
jgi:hypothetical protein